MLIQLRRCLLVVVLFAVSSCVAVAQTAPAATASANKAPRLVNNATEQKIDALLKKMTLQEKVGQLVQYSAGTPTGPGTGRASYEEMIRKGEVGSLFNVTTAREVNAFQRIAVEQSRLHIPIIFGLDVIHGFRTEFPVPLGLAATWNPQLVEQAARVAAREASATGIRWTFSPMVDIARDARWGRIVEGAGEDPYLGSVMAAAYVRGYQGRDLADPDSIAACAKHYVGYGAAEGGRDYNTTEISQHTLREFYLPPFHAAVNAGVATLMSAFNALNGVPASANHFTLTDVLKDQWGFRGFVVSDWASIAELIPHGIANNGETAARKAFQAGVDMDMESGLYAKYLAGLVQSGKVSESALDESVRRVLRVKYAMGLFDHPYADEAREASAMLKPGSLELARTAAEESFVLLKNSAVQNGTPLLPMSKTSTVALIGPLADSAQNMLGSWSAQGKPEDVVTLRKALSDFLGADHVHYAKGAEIIGGTDQGFAEAVQAAQQSDVVIMALGEDAGTMTGEAASRAHLGLPGLQKQLLQAILKTGKPVVLVLFTGRPLTIPKVFEHVPAVMEAWFPGVQAGPALVRVLYGEVNPTGKLTVSWPRAVGQEPLYYDALNTGRPAGNANLTEPPGPNSPKYVSRYIDEQNSPQFPFGYGLSYTTFRYGATKLNVTERSVRNFNTPVTVTAEITNTGSRAAEETAEVYVRLQGTSTAQPVRALKGFQRVQLAPGETKTVTVQLAPDAFGLWNIKNEFAIEPAKVTVWVSPDSVGGTPATFEITR